MQALKTFTPGNMFTLAEHQFIVLEHQEGFTLVITAESIGDRRFNGNFNSGKLNDWRNSTIRAFLNGDFLDSLGESGLDTDMITLTDWDLSDHQGGVGYGTSRDKIGLLSQKQFEKYAEQDLLELDDWWWLITPYAGLSYGARLVDTDGSLGNSGAYLGSLGVRPAFRLESEILVSLIER